MMFWGNFISSLIIVSIASLIELDKDEEGVYYQITNNKALENSMIHASDLIKSFLRYTITKKKSEAAAKASGAPSGTLLNKTLLQEDLATKKAEFIMRQRAKRFREVNSQLMMSASQVPINTLIQNVFNSVDK
jgi:uncharacterized protein YbjT (DUF2867 family)